MRILITEKIAQEGIQLLNTLPIDITLAYSLSREELLKQISNYDALIVRSVTKVDEELYSRGTRLKVIGRAGNGVDNIDMEGATKRGIIIVNTPDANTVSAAEHTISLLLSLCRHIPRANTHIKNGVWDRSPFRGIELMGKTLGIIGLGRIGSLVATRMKAFDMNIIAYDPYIPNKKFDSIGVTKCKTLEDLMKVSDVVSVHTPKTKETIGLVNADHFKLCKPSLRIVNCARGGIIDEEDLYEALTTSKIAGAAIDVLKDEPNPISPLLKLNETVITPHLGADTFEAQRNVGETVAREVYEALKGELVTNAVNLPALNAIELKNHLPFIHLCETLGLLYSQICSEPLIRIDICFRGDVQSLKTELLYASLLKGIFSHDINGQINYVNAKYIASQKGIVLYESHDLHDGNHTNAIQVTLRNQNSEIKLEGAITMTQEVKITSINDYSFDLSTQGFMLLIENSDRPGMIGTIGNLLGKKSINISQMNVSLKDGAANALMLLKTDTIVDHDMITSLKQTPGIFNVWPLHFAK